MRPKSSPTLMIVPYKKIAQPKITQKSGKGKPGAVLNKNWMPKIALNFRYGSRWVIDIRHIVMNLYFEIVKSQGYNFNDANNRCTLLPDLLVTRFSRRKT